MKYFRLFPIVIFLLFMTSALRFGDFVMQLTTGNVTALRAADALAEEAKPKKEDKKEEKGKEGEAKPERQEIPAKSASGKETEVKGLDEADPFMTEYSDEEVKVLQSLSKRRGKLEQRERDLDQREKLLQAAEKKVDEKVVEMNKLKQNLETLLDKQNKMQDERIAQLVKIYENMKPKDAANIFNEMQFDVLLEMIDKMSERKVAPILAAMEPARARDVSAKLAEQRALPKRASGAVSDGNAARPGP